VIDLLGTLRGGLDRKRRADLLERFQLDPTKRVAPTRTVKEAGLPKLLFRGFLLPRMNGVFKRKDWLANGLLFAGYHLHVPWVIPGTLLVDTFAVAYPAKRYRSAWIGIAVHSAQSVFLGVLILTLVV